MCDGVAELLKLGIGPEKLADNCADIHKLPLAAAC
jgi:hypothetical protein